MRPNSVNKIYLLLVLTVSSGCRTVSPRKHGDVLDGKSIDGGKSDSSDPGMEDGGSAMDPSSDPATMWSPASRRANAMYQFLVAEKLLHAGDFQGAENHFESSYNLDPNSYSGAQLVRSKLLVSPKSQEGLTEARRMALLYPLDANLRLMYGQALFMTGDMKEGALQLRKAIELEPHLEDAYVALVKGLQIQGKVSDAIAVARSMVKTLPNSAQGWTMLSRLLIGAKRVKEALDPARRAWEIQENNPELALIYALTLDLNKRGKEAVKLYEQLYRFNPGNQELVARMVSLYKELGNLSTALSLLDDMIENSKDEVPGLKMQKVIILWELGRNEDALKVSLALEAEMPESDRVLFMTAVALIKVGRNPEGIARFAKIQDESTLKSDAMRQQALLLKETGKISEALSVAKALTERADAESSGFVIWAEILAADGKPVEAVSVVEKAIEKFPDNQKLLFTKGAYQERAGDYSSAEKSMRAVIDKNPQDASALNFLGYMLADAGRDLDEAEKLIQRALALQPENGGFVDSLGWVYYQKKQYKKALETLESAVRMEEEEGVIWEHLADSLLALGEKKKAFEKYKEALKRKNDTKDQTRMQNKFDALKAELATGG